MTHQSRAVVSRHIFITDGSQTPEGLLCGHVHQQETGYGSLGLAVAHLGPVDGVGLQHLKQGLLSAREMYDIVVIICLEQNNFFFVCVFIINCSILQVGRLLLVLSL